MPRTISEGFEDFYTKLTPSSTEREAAKAHRASIEACLKSNFEMSSFFRVGSFGNGTSISGYSDVDYFAVIPTENLKEDSGNTLTAVRNALAGRFPNTGVAVNCPAVKIPFGTDAKETTEIVPADYVKQVSGYNVYHVPDCSGGWMYSSPPTHNAYVRDIDNKFNGKVKKLIRFIKAWKFYKNVPISSFYLELRAAKYALAENAIIYDIDVKNIFAHLYNIDLAKMQDPKGISGYISACSTSAKHTDAMSKLETALKRASEARAAESNGNTKDAFYWWDLLYDSKFPSYYK